MDSRSPVEILKRMKAAVSIECWCAIRLYDEFRDDSLVLVWSASVKRKTYGFNLVVSPSEMGEIDRLIDQAGCSLNRQIRKGQ